MKKISLAMKLARWHYTPIIVVPVLIGAVLAWYQGYPFRWFEFFLCLTGAWFAHLGANAANDCFDDISGVDKFAYENIPQNRGSTVCGSEILTRGLLSRREGFAITGLFFLLALCCGVPLTLQLGGPIIAMAVGGFFLAIFYCAKPIRFGYIGRGLGELIIFIAFGVLPVLGSYFVQTASFSWSAVLASVPPGLFTVSVLYNHHFTHASADSAVDKRSPVVILGEERARQFSPLLLAAAYIVLVADVVLGVFPIAALVSLVTAPFIFSAYIRLPIPSTCEQSLSFLFNVVRTNVVTGSLVVVALLITRTIL